jgi:uncharacterized phage protein (TIGR01671 family)
MNREIKFRIWDAYLKRLSGPEGLGVMIRNGSIDHVSCRESENGYSYSEWGSAQHPLDQERYALMQFTGLKDKNGVEIYEGDILLLNGIRHNRGIYAAVEFDAEGRFIETDTRNTIGKLSSLRVVGNVYENPELIQSQAATV